jgi:hypothetical protein
MKQLITELKSKLNNITIVTQDGINSNLFAILWNNQIENQLNGQSLALPNICAFIEIIVDSSNAVGGNSYNIQSDITINIHLQHTHYNTEFSNDENLLVYDLRKLVIDSLYGFKSNSMVATLDKTGEQMDFNHSNIYHYIITYKTTIREQISQAGVFTLSQPPTQLQINVNEIQQLPNL